jgi:sugar phosphate isomerase/epimerase
VDGWDQVGKSLEPIAAKVKEAGIRFAYHNHAHEFEGDGLDKFYAATDPELVLAELDLAWVHIGGQDPAAYLRKMGKRAPLVHLKDYDPNEKPQWRPAGTGVLDFDSILAACDELGVEYGAIELDESPGDPIDAVRQSYEFFKSKGLS